MTKEAKRHAVEQWLLLRLSGVSSTEASRRVKVNTTTLTEWAKKFGYEVQKLKPGGRYISSGKDRSTTETTE